MSPARKVVALAIAISLAVVTLTLCFQKRRAMADLPEPYPLGVEQGGSVGNRHVGHVRITHTVTLDLINGGYKYRYEFSNQTGKLCRLTWPTVDLLEQGEEINPRGLSYQFRSEQPPVWRLAPLTLEIRDGDRWIKVGTWYQKGPIPSK